MVSHGGWLKRRTPQDQVKGGAWRNVLGKQEQPDTTHLQKVVAGEGNPPPTWAAMDRPAGRPASIRCMCGGMRSEWCIRKSREFIYNDRRWSRRWKDCWMKNGEPCKHPADEP
jgi:hypothetical protein